ncbi:hypothetical protein TNCV_4641401 [Trichonephila clavipes]|nr:hypothetical protein TNCV_4641401 [Trichonephila clavipes]
MDHICTIFTSDRVVSKSQSDLGPSWPPRSLDLLLSDSSSPVSICLPQLADQGPKEKLGISDYLSTGNSGKTVLLCDDRRSCIGLGLPPYIIITHSVKRWQSEERVSQLNHAHLFRVIACASI